MEKPLISIIIPVYNVEKFIDKCIRSVINQTQKNFEVIIVDDCSPDNSISISKGITEQYSSDDISFVYLCHKKNKGLSASRNTGIEYAHGDYLYFLDSDDYIDERCIENFSMACERYPDVDLVQGNGDSNSIEFRNALQVVNKYPQYITDRLLIQKLLLVPRLFPVTAWNKLVKKELLINYDVWFKEGLIHEDVHFCFHLSKVIHNLAIVKDVTYYYFVRPNSIMTNAKLDQEFKSLSYLIEDILLNLSPGGKLYQRHRFAVLFFYNIIHKHMYENENEVWLVYDSIKARSDKWGKTILVIWRFLPNFLKRQKHISLLVSWIYSIL